MRFLLPVAVALLLAGCGSTGTRSNVSCKSTVYAGPSSQELTDALAKAGPGDCVFGAEATYKGSFTVPAGARLVSNTGSSMSVVGDSADQAAITVMGAEGSGLFGVHIGSAAGVGVQVVGGPATLTDVAVRGAANAALIISCSGPTCRDAASTIEVQRPDLRDSAIGLWAYAARVTVTGGTVTGTRAQSLATGYAVVASAGAALQMDSTSVSANQDVGVLVDGAFGTSAELTNVEVSKNLGRGVWAQGLLGSDAEPKLVIRGAATAIDGNAVVGVGARESAGISISDARITRTVKVAVPSTSSGKLEPVGDGVGLFAGTGATRLERTSLEDNQRSQVLIDTGSRGIIIVDSGRVAGGEYKVVVQKTAEPVTVPAEFLSPITSGELPVSSPLLPVGAR